MKRYSVLIKIFPFYLILFVTNFVYAGITERGTGMAFGDNHAFFFTAPKGWVLDNQSGVTQGIHMVFYPVGETWASSPVMAYGNSATKDEKIKSIHDQVAITLNELHKSGSPNSKAEKKLSLELPNNIEVAIYYFEQDKWGNYEAVGYIEEERTINLLVFNTRSKKAFDEHIAAFTKLLHSYKNAYSKNINENLFQQLVKQAEKDAGTPEGKTYETRAIDTLGQSMANFMKDCTSYFPENELSDFELIFRIKANGNISEAFARPTNALSTCSKGIILNKKFPPHQFESFSLHINMKTKR